MTRSARFLALTSFFAFVMGLLADPPSSVASGNCQARLVGNSYDCSLKVSDIGQQTNCVEFAHGEISTNFDLVIPGVQLGCSCLAKGSFKSASLDASADAFECVSGDGFEFNGKVASGKISGQGANDAGESFIFSCTVRSTPCL